MKKLFIVLSAAVLTLIMMFAGCRANRQENRPQSKSIVATYSVLAALVQELAGSHFTVHSLIPNGLDLHDWEPSAKDIESVTGATLLVQNGLGLEHELERIIDLAGEEGVRLFAVGEHIDVRELDPAEGLASDHGAEDPHVWLDPLAMKEAMLALATYMENELGVDLSREAAALAQRLDALDAEIRQQVASLPPENRQLVTGHESLGYFAERYGFEIVGAVVPGLTTQAEVSAAHLAELKRLIEEENVKAVFTEAGTPSRVVEALARETGVKVVSLNTHVLPEDNSYFTFMQNLADTIVGALR